jgi:hypothetical protein
MKHKKAILIGAAILLVGGVAYARRRKKPSGRVPNAGVTVGSVDCIDGGCEGDAPASGSWLSKYAPDHFLDFPTFPGF